MSNLEKMAPEQSQPAADSSKTLSDSVWSRMLEPQAHLDMWKRCATGNGSLGDYAGCVGEGALGVAAGLEFAAVSAAGAATTIVASEGVAIAGAAIKGTESYRKHKE